MRRRGGVAALLLAGVAALSACSPISAGTITEKDHSDSYYYTTYDQHCTSYNVDGLCVTSIPVPRQVYVPEKWSFDITDGDKDGWVTVSEDTWHSHEVGDYYGEKPQRREYRG